MNSLPITSRDVASGSTRENTVLKKNSSSPALVSIAYVPCSSVTKWAIEPSARAHHDAEVGQPPHEQRVAGAEHVGGRRIGARRGRPRTWARSCAGTGRAASGSTKCSTTATSGPGLLDLGVALVEHGRAQPGGEPAHPFAARARRSRRTCAARRPDRRRRRFRTVWLMTVSRPAGHARKRVGPPSASGESCPVQAIGDARTRRQAARRCCRTRRSLPVGKPDVTTAVGERHAGPCPSARHRVSMLPARSSASPPVTRASRAAVERRAVERRSLAPRAVGDRDERRRRRRTATAACVRDRHAVGRRSSTSRRRRCCGTSPTDAAATTSSDASGGRRTWCTSSSTAMRRAPRCRRRRSNVGCRRRGRSRAMRRRRRWRSSTALAAGCRPSATRRGRRRCRSDGTGSTRAGVRRPAARARRTCRRTRCGRPRRSTVRSASDFASGVHVPSAPCCQTSCASTIANHVPSGPGVKRLDAVTVERGEVLPARGEDVVAVDGRHEHAHGTVLSRRAVAPSRVRCRPCQSARPTP